MREEFVIGAVARVGDDFARGGVHRTSFHSGLRGCQRGALGSMYDVEDLFHFVFRFVGGFAEHKRTRDVGRIAFHRAAAVDEHDRAFPNSLRLDRAVGESGKLADLYIGAAVESQFSVRRFQKVFDIPLRHANFHRTVGCLVGGERDLRCQPHQVDFMPALDHATAGGDWSRARESSAGCGFPQVVGEDKLYRLLDANRAAGDAVVAQSLCDAGVGALVFLPDAKVGFAAIGRLRNLFARPTLLERRRHVKRFALGG